jgi:predicted RNase H-like HicB family nuclease
VRFDEPVLSIECDPRADTWNGGGIAEHIREALRPSSPTCGNVDDASTSSLCHDLPMNQSYTALVKRDGDWWIGWVEEIPGVNAQERSKEELLSSLREALSEALEFNREEALAAAGEHYDEEPIAV